MSCFVYVLKSLKAGKCYVGITNNIARRLEEHNAGSSRYTRNRGPWQLVYLEKRRSEREARNREKFLKSGDGRQVLMRMLGKKK